MKQFSNIFKFEFMSYGKNKTFLGITLALIIIIGVVLSFPRFGDLFKGDDKPETEGEVKAQTIFISDPTVTDHASMLAIFAAAMPDEKFEFTDKSSEELKTLINNDEYGGAVVVTSPTAYTYITKTISMTDSTQYTLNEVMTMKYRFEKMTALGLTPEQSTDLFNTEVTGTVITTGKDQASNFFYTYILIFALYMAIMLYGQFVATSVATEKSSRAMELLITSAKPSSLMFGKVLGAGAAGLIQMSAILGSAFLFFNINKQYWGGNELVNSIFNMPISILLYTILFFVLGFAIYSFLFGAVGSLASKVEDINTSVMPITYLFIIAFLIVMFSMTSGNVDSVLMIIASYIPFTSPMAMFTRIAMGDVAAWEIIVSVIILVVSTVGTGYLSAKIYKVGVLLYGKPPKLSSVLKAINSKSK